MERRHRHLVSAMLLACALTSFSSWLVWNTLSAEAAFSPDGHDFFHLWPYAVAIGAIIGCVLGVISSWTSARPHRTVALANGAALLLFAFLSQSFVQPMEIALLYVGTLGVCTVAVTIWALMTRNRLDAIRPFPRTGCLVPIRFYVFLASLLPLLAGMGMMTDIGVDGVRDLRNPRVVRQARVVGYVLEFDKTSKTTPYWVRWEYEWTFGERTFSDRILETFATEQERTDCVQKLDTMKQHGESFSVHVSPVCPTVADRDFRSPDRQTVTGAFRDGAVGVALALLAILFNAQIAGLILQFACDYSKGFAPHMEKRCSACGALVPLSSRARERCPSCNAYWSFMSTHYK